MRHIHRRPKVLVLIDLKGALDSVKWAALFTPKVMLKFLNLLQALYLLTYDRLRVCDETSDSIETTRCSTSVFCLFILDCSNVQDMRNALYRLTGAVARLIMRFTQLKSKVLLHGSTTRLPSLILDGSNWQSLLIPLIWGASWLRRGAWH